MCAEPLQGRRTTYTECCCLYGIAWSGQCALCPRRDSGERQHSSSSSSSSSAYVSRTTNSHVLLLSDDYAIMCNLPRRGGSDSLRERPGYEYGLEGPEDPVEPFLPPYWDNYGGAAGPYDIPESVPLFNDNDYSARQPPARVPVHRPRENPPRLLDPYAGGFQSPFVED